MQFYSGVLVVWLSGLVGQLEPVCIQALQDLEKPSVSVKFVTESLATGTEASFLFCTPD